MSKFQSPAARPSRASIVARAVVLIAFAGGVAFIGVRSPLLVPAVANAPDGGATAMATSAGSKHDAFLGLLDASLLGFRRVVETAAASDATLVVARTEDPMRVWEYYPLPDDTPRSDDTLRPDVELQPPTF